MTTTLPLIPTPVGHRPLIISENSLFKKIERDACKHPNNEVSDTILSIIRNQCYQKPSRPIQGSLPTAEEKILWTIVFVMLRCNPEKGILESRITSALQDFKNASMTKPKKFQMPSCIQCAAKDLLDTSEEKISTCVTKILKNSRNMDALKKTWNLHVLLGPNVQRNLEDAMNEKTDLHLEHFPKVSSGDNTAPVADIPVISEEKTDI